MTTCQYVGIIDMDGLDSFARVEPREELLKAFADPQSVTKSEGPTLLKMLRMRAWGNAGRHPILFVCELTEEDVDLMEGGTSLWKAQVVLRNSKRLGFESGGKQNWSILKKLVPEYKGEYGEERYQIRTLRNM